MQGTQSQFSGGPFAVINGALAEDVICVYIPKAVELEKTYSCNFCHVRYATQTMVSDVSVINLASYTKMDGGDVALSMHILNSLMNLAISLHTLAIGSPKRLSETLHIVGIAEDCDSTQILLHLVQAARQKAGCHFVAQGFW